MSKAEKVEFETYLKQQENIGNGVLKRVEELRKATKGIGQFSESSEADLDAQARLKHEHNENRRRLEKAEENAYHIEELTAESDVRDNRHAEKRVEMDMKMITVQTLENLY